MVKSVYEKALMTVCEIIMIIVLLTFLDKRNGKKTGCRNRKKEAVKRYETYLEKLQKLNKEEC